MLSFAPKRFRPVLPIQSLGAPPRNAQKNDFKLAVAPSGMERL
jgi:hypothetical protein